MRHLAFALTALTVLLPLRLVHAANLPGQPCSQLGATQMADDRANIIACMLKTGSTSPSITDCTTGGGCVWKATTGGSGGGDCKAQNITFWGTSSGFGIYQLPESRNGDVYCISISGAGGQPMGMSYVGNYLVSRISFIPTPPCNNTEHGHTVPNNYYCDKGLWYGPSYTLPSG